MNAKEAIKAIESETLSVKARLVNNRWLRLYSKGGSFLVDGHWFLECDLRGGWEGSSSNWQAMQGVDPEALSVVMDTVKWLFATPVEDRFPEKKYRLRWLDDDDGMLNYLYPCEDDGMVSWVKGSKLGGFTITESELDQLKKDNPKFAPAIEAMKEEVTDDEE